VTATPATFDTLAEGQKLRGRVTLTEAHVVLASGIFGDFAPVHMDELFARGTSFGARIAHGNLVVGVMVGVLGKALGRHALGLVEQQARFRAPVFFGDTVTTEWEVAGKAEQHDLDGGVVRFRGTCATERGVVVEAEAHLTVGNGTAP
jgi:acyl dehydratase